MLIKYGKHASVWNQRDSFEASQRVASLRKFETMSNNVYHNPNAANNVD